MVAVTTYEVVAKPWRRGWELIYQGDTVTQSRTLAGAGQQFSDWLESLTGEPPRGGIVVHADLDGAEVEVELVRARIDKARQELAEAAGAWRALAVGLHETQDLSVRDTAEVMRVSPGRVSQLIRD